VKKADTERYEKLVEIGCVVCKLFHDGVYSPPEIHHLITFPKKENQRTIPLCHNHHNARIDCIEFTSRHPFKFKFEDRYGSEESLLEYTNDLLA